MREGLWTPGPPRLWTPLVPRRPFGPEWGDEPYEWPDLPAIRPLWAGFVQARNTTGTADPTTLAFSSNVTAGSLLVCTVQVANTASMTVTDSLQAGNWSTAINHSTANSANDSGVWYRENTLGGSCTVSVHGGASNMQGICIYEASGVLTSSSLDKTTSTEVNGSSITSGSQTPAGANGDIVVSVLASATQNVTYSNSTSGWNVRTNNTPNASMSAALADFTWSSGGVTTTWSVTGGAQDLSVLVVSFKLAATASLPLMGRRRDPWNPARAWSALR